MKGGRKQRERVKLEKIEDSRGRERRGKGTGEQGRQAAGASRGGQGGKGCVWCALGALYLLALSLPPLLLPPQGLHVLQPLLFLLLQLPLLPLPPLLLWMKRGVVLRTSTAQPWKGVPRPLLGAPWKGDPSWAVQAVSSSWMTVAGKSFNFLQYNPTYPSTRAHRHLGWENCCLREQWAWDKRLRG